MTYSMVFRISACIIMLFAGILAVGGDLSFANLAVILIASFTIFNPIEVMGQMTTMIRTMDAALDRVEHIKKAKKIDENGRDLPLDSFDIAFEHVSFAYENGNPILKNVSFSIPQGSMTAIVGPSGGGKTTITRLIARFWDVQEGSITVGGHDVKEFTCDSLLKNMSMVFQNVYLFHDTIENNIRIAKRDATREEVEAACKKAALDGFIHSLPKGYGTPVGELGGALSGGERQRIGVARAFLHDAPFLLLDEPTSNLDSLNEGVILKAVRAECKDKTVLLVSHRKSTMAAADISFSVESGRLS